MGKKEKKSARYFNLFFFFFLACVERVIYKSTQERGCLCKEREMEGIKRPERSHRRGFYGRGFWRRGQSDGGLSRRGREHRS